MTISVNYDTVRPKACAFFAGRAWYAGIPSGEKLGWVMFSQVLDDITHIEKCYQQNDPTSEVFSDLLDNDGGLVQIPEAGEIVALVPLSKSLFVFGSTGVWQIIGGGDTGFTATAYSVEKVTSVGCLFQKSVVRVEDSIFYWSNSGIYVLIVNQGGLTASVKNISDIPIKALYTSIPTINKVYVDGKYNDSSKTIHWLYNGNTLTDTSTGKYRKSKMLCFNVQLNSFYTLSIDNDAGPIVTSLAVTKETVETSVDYNVLVGVDEVVSGGDNVIALIPALNPNIKDFKYLTVIPTAPTTCSITWADTTTTYFSDWRKHNNVGVEKPAFVLTGYNMGNNGPARAKTASYLHAFLRRTETSLDAEALPVNPSGCLLQTRWDFTDNAFPSKWSDDVQIYRQLRPYWGEPNTAFEDGYPLVITKNKLRGRGKALQIKLNSEATKDMVVVGWSIGMVGNTNV